MTNILFPLGSPRATAIPLGRLVRLAPIAAQAMATEQPRLLRTVLSLLDVSWKNEHPAAVQLATAFALSRFASPLAPEMDPAKVAATLRERSPGGDRLYSPLPLPGHYERWQQGLPPLYPKPPFRVLPNSRREKDGDGDQILQVEGALTTSVTNTCRNAVIDLRNILFIHSLDEKTVRDVIAHMKSKIARVSPLSPPSSLKSVLSQLTLGDKSGSKSPIRVGREIGGRAPYLLLNGHHRIAALCLLALAGEIPFHWLTEIPVMMHEIVDRKAFDVLTSHHLIPLQVLAEVTLDGYCAAEALDVLAFCSRSLLSIRNQPSGMPRGPAYTRADLMALDVMRGKLGEIRLSKMEFVFKLLATFARQAVGGQEDLVDQLMFRLPLQRKRVRMRLFQMIRSIGINHMTEEILLHLFGTRPDEVLSFLALIVRRSRQQPRLLRSVVHAYRRFQCWEQLRQLWRTGMLRLAVEVSEIDWKLLGMPVGRSLSMLLAAYERTDGDLLRKILLRRMVGVVEGAQRDLDTVNWYFLIPKYKADLLNKADLLKRVFGQPRLWRRVSVFLARFGPAFGQAARAANKVATRLSTA